MLLVCPAIMVAVSPVTRLCTPSVVMTVGFAIEEVRMVTAAAAAPKSTDSESVSQSAVFASQSCRMTPWSTSPETQYLHVGLVQLAALEHAVIRAAEGPGHANEALADRVAFV